MAKTTRIVARNFQLAAGVMRYSQSAMFSRRAMYKIKRTKTAPKKGPSRVIKIKQIGGEKNGGTRRVIVPKQSKFYPVEDVPKKMRKTKTPHPTRLRKSITPGTVLILLSGPHKGKKVVFLKQLQPSGLLLVTGPFKVNGVPLRRVDQAYVIATRTKIELGEVKIPERVSDQYFARKKESHKKKPKDDIFDKKAEVYKPSPERIEDQTVVDSQVEAVLKNTDQLLTVYLSKPFSLSRGQYPHKMVF